MSLFKPSFSRAIALLGLLGLGLSQVGCAHPVVVEPSVTVYSRSGHFPVLAPVGMPGPVVQALPPQVIYLPPPPPRVVYVPRVYAPVYGWGHGHEGRQRGHERRHYRHDEREHGRGGREPRHDGRR